MYVRIAHWACILVAAVLSSAVDVESRGEMRDEVPGPNLHELAATNALQARDLNGGKYGRGHLRGRDIRSSSNGIINVGSQHGGGTPTH